MKIRQSVFETNSSSMHSLVIAKNGHTQEFKELLEHKYIGEKGVYNIWDSEIDFDRSPFRILNNAIDKLLYLIADTTKDETRKELLEMFYQVYPEIKELKFPKSYNDDEVEYGYVDHQSKGFVTNYLLENNILAKDFITNTKYSIIIDGDEYCEWENFKRSGLIDIAKIETDINPWNSKTKTYEDEEGFEE